MSSEPFETTIGEQLTLQRGFDITRKQQQSGPVPVVSSGGISSYHSEAKVNGPGVVLGRKGSLGTVFFLEERFWPHDTTLWVKDFKGNNPRFVYYFFSGMAGELKKMDVGAANPALNRNHVHPLSIRWLSRESQDEVVKTLSSLDRKISLNRQINQTLEQMAQAIFKSWFVDFDPVKAKIAALDAGGSEEDALLAAMQAISGKSDRQLERLRNASPKQYAELCATAELFPSAMQKSVLGDIPEGWEVLPLSNMVDLLGGGTPKKSEPSYWNGDICWFSVKDAPKEGDVFVIDTEDKITDAGLNGSSTKLLPIGTAIITARGTVGKLALTGVVTAMNQSCYGVVASDGSGPYLNYLRLCRAVDTLKRNTHGAVFDTITRTTFETVVQSQSSLEVRQRFEKLVEPVFEAIKGNLHEAKTLCELRDTLLPKLLSGELTIPVAEEQVAEVADA